MDEAICLTCDQTDGICGHTGKCRDCAGECLKCDGQQAIDLSTPRKYYFLARLYDVEAMMKSGLITYFEYVEENGETFMIIHTSDCCDHWFA